jgi:O-antigen/teichoic acid export membrane protein
LDLFRNFVSTFATSALSFPIQLATSIVLARFLSVEDRGVYSLAIAFAMLASLLCELGWGPAVIHRVRRVGSPPARVATNAIAVILIVPALAALVCLPFADGLREHLLDGAPPDVLGLAILIVPLHIGWIVFGSLARALDRFSLQNGWLLAGTVLRLAATGTALVAFGGALHEALVAYAAVEAITALGIAAGVLARTGVEPRLDRRELREGASFGARAQVFRVAEQLQRRIDVFAIAYFHDDPQQVAFYAVAMALITQMQLLPDTLGRALYPQLAGIAERTAGAQTARANRHLLAWMLAATAVAAPCAPWVLPMLYGQPYAASLTPFLVLLLALLPWTAFRTLSFYFVSVGRQRPNVVAQLLATAVALVLNVALVPGLGIIGAALAYLLSVLAGAVFLSAAFLRDSGFGLAETLVARRTDFADYRRRLEPWLRRWRLVR